jgi:hypothetical protein
MGKLTGMALAAFNAAHPRGPGGKFVKAGGGSKRRESTVLGTLARNAAANPPTPNRRGSVAQRLAASKPGGALAAMAANAAKVQAERSRATYPTPLGGPTKPKPFQVSRDPEPGTTAAFAASLRAHGLHAAAVDLEEGGGKMAAADAIGAHLRSLAGRTKAQRDREFLADLERDLRGGGREDLGLNRPAPTGARIEPKPAASGADDIAARLNSATSRADGDAIVAALTTAQLREVAKRINVYIGGLNKGEAQQRIVERAVGSRLNSAAIRDRGNFAGAAYLSGSGRTSGGPVTPTVTPTARDKFEAPRRESTENRGQRIEADIRSAVADLAREPGGYVTLEDVRTRLSSRGYTRAEVDRVLDDMFLQPGVVLTPESNQKVLTSGQRAAAVNIGMQDQHLISIQGIGGSSATQVSSAPGKAAKKPMTARQKFAAGTSGLSLTPQEAVTRLRGMSDRRTGELMLARASRADLVAILDAEGIPYLKGSNKDRLRRDIIESLIGRRADSLAIARVVQGR